jgi:hypothetical protein
VNKVLVLVFVMKMVVQKCLKKNRMIKNVILNNLPLFGGHVKYRTPPTQPSCLPVGSSSSIPYQRLTPKGTLPKYLIVPIC